MSDKEEEPMKTHREHLMEKLEAQRQPQEASFGTAHMRHLLLFADVLDEREATHLPGVRKLIETPTSEPKAFPDELVERLARVSWGADCASIGESQCVVTASWSDGANHTKEAARASIRAVLSELAKAPVDLPSGDELTKLLGYQPWYNASTVIAACRKRIAPVLAAKDVQIERLQSVVRFQNKCAEDTVSRGVHESHVADLKTRIAELVVASDANHQKFRDATTAFDNERERHRRTTSELGMAREQVTNLGKRIAELTAPVAVDGKTPGQELHHRLRHSFDSDFVGLCKPWEFCLDSTRRAMDRIAASVLRFHGGEVLRRVREKAEKIETHFRDGSDTKQSHMAKGAIKDFVAIVDDELAKLGHLTATDKPTRQCRHGLDGCALFENFAGALRVLGFVVAKPAAVDWIEVGGILNEVIDILTRPEGKLEASAPNPLDKLRERFTYTPEPGDGDGGKWVKRSDVLNAIDEIDTPA